MRVVVGAPANGATLKDELKTFLEKDERVTDVVDPSTPATTYPDVSFQAARLVVEGAATERCWSAAPAWAPRSPQAR